MPASNIKGEDVQVRDWNWPLIAFLVQMAGIVWIAATQSEKLNQLILKVDKIEAAGYTKAEAASDARLQRVRDEAQDARLMGLERRR